jgi:hypothetical protein
MQMANVPTIEHEVSGERRSDRTANRRSRRQERIEFPSGSASCLGTAPVYRVAAGDIGRKTVDFGQAVESSPAHRT